MVSMAAVPSQSSPHKLSFSSPCASEPEERWSKCDKYADLEKVMSAHVCVCVCVRERERERETRRQRRRERERAERQSQGFPPG